MTKKRARAIRGMEIAELEQKIASLRAELAKERASISAGTRPENPGRVRRTKRDISRHLTILHERKKKEVKKA